MTNFKIFYHAPGKPPRSVKMLAKSALDAMRLFKQQFPQSNILIDKIV